MAFDVRAFLRDRKVWVAGAAGGGLGLYVYLRRRRQQAAGGVDVATGQPITPAIADSGQVDAYNNLQSEIENLQGQLTALYGGAPLPSPQQAVAPTPAKPTAKPTATSPAALLAPGSRLRLRQSYRLGDFVEATLPRGSLSAPAALASAQRQLLAANPTIARRLGAKASAGSVLRAGWVIHVPGG